MNLNGPANGGGAATSSGILFQQQLGAHFAAQILSGSRLDARLGLGEASPVWLRFETEAPVDDILVATSADGFIAIQAKTTLSLSDDKKILLSDCRTICPPMVNMPGWQWFSGMEQAS